MRERVVGQRGARRSGWIGACGWIWCTMMPKNHPQARIHPGKLRDRRTGGL